MMGPWESSIHLWDMGIWFNTNLYSQISVQNLRTRLRDKGMFIVERLRKGRDSTTMNFRDMGPFENPLVTHGNIGFNISGPPGGNSKTASFFLTWIWIRWSWLEHPFTVNQLIFDARKVCGLAIFGWYKGIFLLQSDMARPTDWPLEMVLLPG